LTARGGECKTVAAELPFTQLKLSCATLPIVPADIPVFVPGFLEDVFISYAHQDEGAEKWVSNFRDLLAEKLKYELQADVRVWSDAQLAAGDVLDATLKNRIQHTAVVASIVSDWYFDRPWCQREIEYFLSAVEASGGLMVGTKSRYVPVLKRPTNKWPEIIKKLDPLQALFCKDDDTFPPVVTGGSDFLQSTWKLARDLKELLKAMKEASAAKKAESHTVLVLVPMSGQRSKEYDLLRNTLRNKSCVVRPEGQVPFTREGIVETLKSELVKTRLVIHLLGTAYDVVPAQGQGVSVEALACEIVRNSGKRQFIWPGKEQREDDQQRAFLEKLKSLRDEKTELVAEKEFSEFLETLPEELEKSADKEEVHDEGIYLICDKADLQQPEYVALRSFLIGKGYPLTPCSFQGDPDDLRSLEEEQILSHDITLIYYGKALDSWANRKISDSRKVLLKEPAEERPKRALYLGPPDEDGLKLATYEPYLGREMPEIAKMSILVLGNAKGFVPGDLNPLGIQP
jgi:hypothetical protein